MPSEDGGHSLVNAFRQFQFAPSLIQLDLEIYVFAAKAKERRPAGRVPVPSEKWHYGELLLLPVNMSFH